MIRITVEIDDSLTYHKSPRSWSPSWVALQDVIQSCLTGNVQAYTEDEDRLLLTRIHRVDGGCEYRGHGKYEIETSDGRTIRLNSEDL